MKNLIKILAASLALAPGLALHADDMGGMDMGGSPKAATSTAATPVAASETQRAHGVIKEEIKEGGKVLVIKHHAIKGRHEGDDHVLFPG